MSLPPGPHLLGRIYVPDDRDWTPAQLHAHLEHTAPPDAIADMTVRQIVTTTSYFSSWSAILAFWRWLKAFFRPTPQPAPAPAPHPAWTPGPVLDQGDLGTCVGNGWAGWGDATPVVDTYTETDARAIYYEATCIDGACDPTGQNGATVRSGAKAMQKRSKLTAYAFATSLVDIDEWIDNHGPVVIGSDWTNDMFDPDPHGYVAPTGAVAGGHCYLMIDRLDDEGAYLFRNSWGASWGLGGNFKMRRTDLQKLLDQHGEACLAAEVAA